MTQASLVLIADTAQVQAALRSLAEIAQRAPQLVDGLVGLLQSTDELVRVDPDVFPASRANEYRVVFQPSQRLVDFLAAARARDIDGFGVEVDVPPFSCDGVMDSSQIANVEGLSGRSLSEAAFADRAVMHDGPRSHVSLPGENDFAPVVEARLTDVVLRLRQGWIALCAGQWTSLCAINEHPGTDLEKRIAPALREGFLQFSQLLAGAECLLLQRQELGVVSEQSILGLEQLVVHLRNSSRHLVEVAQVEHEREVEARLYQRLRAG